MLPPLKGSFSAVPKDVDLAGRRLDHLLLPPRPVEIGLGRIEPVLANPRVDERPLPVHVLHALLEAPALPLLALRVARIRAVEAVREDRLRDDDVDAADRVDQLAEPVEVDDRDVVDVEPGQVLDRLERQRRPTELRRGVELGGHRARGSRP